VNSMKLTVLLALTAGWGLLGWRMLQRSASDATDDELFAGYAMVAPELTQPPHNAEAHKRVAEGRITLDMLAAKLGKGSPTERRAACRMMIHLPQGRREEALGMLRAEWERSPSTELKKDIILVCRELPMRDKGVAAEAGATTVKFLVHKVLRDAAKEIQAEGAAALKELTEQRLHSPVEWQTWYNDYGARFRIKPRG